MKYVQVMCLRCDEFMFSLFTLVLFLAAEDIGAKTTKTRAEKWKSRWQNFPHIKQQARCFIISSSEIQAPGWLAWSIQLHLKPSGYSLVGEFVDDLLCFQITSKNWAASFNRSWLDSSSTWGPVSVLFAVSAMHAVESAPWEPWKKNTPNPFATKSLSLSSIMGQKIAWRIYFKDGLWYFRFFPIIGLYRTVASRAFHRQGRGNSCEGLSKCWEAQCEVDLLVGYDVWCSSWKQSTFHIHRCIGGSLTNIFLL